MRKVLLFFGIFMAIMAGLVPKGFAQPVIAPYPVAAAAVTRGLDTGLLTVKIKFTGPCTGITVAIHLSDGMTYVPGSFKKTGGTLSLGSYIGGGTRTPQFSIPDVTSAADSLTFTIGRTAGCGLTASAKDSVYISSSAGNVSETAASVNSYVVYSPSLSISAVSAINGANTGRGYSRTFGITNGGNGCLDTLWVAAIRNATSLSAARLLAGTTLIAPYKTNADTSFYKISGALLSGTGLLCNGQTVNLTDSFILNSCNNTGSTFLASWGKSFTDNCQQVNTSGVINMNSGIPSIAAVVSAIPFTACGTIPRTINYTISNNGTAPASNIYVKFGNTYASAFFPYAYFIDTASVMLTLPGGVAAHPATGIIATNIIGGGANAPSCSYSKIGMASLTLPANYTLLPGESIVVSFDVQTCATTACTTGGAYDAGTVAVQVNYKDQCATNNYTLPLGTAGIGPGIRVGGGFTAQVPAQVFAGDCFDYKLEYGTYFSGGTYPNRYIEYKFTLPAGVTFSSVSETVHGDLPLAGYPVQYGNDLVIRYQQDNAGIYFQHLSLKFCLGAAACGDLTIKGQSKTTMDSTCATPIVQYSCADNTFTAVCAAPCATGGATPVRWSHNRISYGAPDNNNDGLQDATGTIDTTLIERSHFRPGDVMRTVVSSVITSNTIAPYTDWPYVFSEWNFPYGQWTLKDSATIVIKRAGSVIHTISGIIPAAVTPGALFRADWSSRLPSGFTYIDGDSVLVFANFKLVGDMYIAGQSANSAYSARVVATGALEQTVYAARTATPPAGGISGPDRYSCFIPKYNYYVLGTEHFAGFFGVDPNGPSGCNDFDVIANAYTLVRDYVTQRFFPFEYRPANIPDTFLIYVPAGWEFIRHNSASMRYNTAPTKDANIAFTIAPSVSGNSGTGTVLKYDMKTALASGALPFIGTEGLIFDIGFKLKPTCSAPARVVTTLVEKGHSAYYPSPDTPAYYTIESPNYLNYDPTNSRPAVVLQDNSGTVQGVAPQQSWDIQINNPSQQTAPNIWLSLEKGSSGISIDSVVLKPSNVVLTANSYGAGNTWYQASTAGIAKGATQMARIYFKYTSCNTDSIKLSAGWNCSGYPSPNPGASLCSVQSLYLKVDPLQSRIQLSMNREPTSPTVGLCETDSVTLVANSALSANVVNPEITLPVPSGMQITIPVKVEYPLNSGVWQNITPTLSGGAYIIKLSDHTGIGANGLPGTITSPGSANRQAKIRVEYNTDCDFVSGSVIPFVATAQRPCAGLSALGSGNIIYTNPIRITGAGVTGAATVSITLNAANMACGDTAALTTLVVPNTDPTITGDSIVYNVPAGMAYAGNFTNLSGCAGCGVNVSAGPIGSSIIKVGLMPGVAAGTAINYTFDLRVTATAGCDTMDINGQAERIITGLSCGATTCTNSKVAIGAAVPARVKLDKPFVRITNMAVEHDTSWIMGIAQKVIVQFSNTGTQALNTNQYNIEFFCGASSTPFDTKLIGKTIAPGTSAADTYSVFVPKAGCASGDLITAKVQAVTNAGIAQCLCAPASYQLLGTPLPLQFMSANAKATNCVVNLDWQYNLAKQTLSGFEIERSSNGSNFSRIAKETADALQFTDVTPQSGNWYYRIKAIGLDGKSVYTPTLKVQTTTCAEATVTIYPNPVKDQLQIILQGASILNTYELIDALGRIILKGDLQGNSNNKIDVSGIIQGVYVLKVLMDENLKTQQVHIRK